MEKNAKRLILLFSLILVVIPMVLFPSRLGLPLVSGSAINMLYEFVFYGVVLYFFRREVPLTTLVAGAALALVYRLALGAVFGVAIIIMYNLDSGVAFSLGMARYLPAVLLHALATPFVVRPVYITVAFGETSPRRRRRQRYEPERPVSQTYEEGSTVSATGASEDITTSYSSDGSSDHRQAVAAGEDGSQLDRAMAYLGESASIKLALLVDAEGLPLARFSRGSEDAELWAPLAVLLENDNCELINRFSTLGSPDRIDIGTDSLRIFLRRIDHVTLMILAERSIDETIHIRLAQAADMIRKYMSERYSPALFARAEERYVSDS